MLEVHQDEFLCAVADPLRRSDGKELTGYDTGPVQLLVRGADNDIQPGVVLDFSQAIFFCEQHIVLLRLGWGTVMRHGVETGLSMKLSDSVVYGRGLKER
ncbi:hypothetical protein HBDW_30200 [Herbaspirillum sp. DW155]|uniref:hypothetical protein n=1 Tax=Herbaspirillum sp. DW155 TaxID=3095609 RepID=UPI003092E435|nr:hypothetical protein HBDW_30200 [Herbaspirillum sp. DW155]